MKHNLIDNIRILGDRFVSVDVGKVCYKLRAENFFGKNIKKGQEVDDELEKFFIAEHLWVYTVEKCLNWLATRSRSKDELQGKLKLSVSQWLDNNSKDIDKDQLVEIINDCLTYLENNQLLDEKTFIQDYIRKSRKKSNTQILFELNKYKVDMDSARLEIRAEQDREAKAIRIYLNKKLNNNKTTDIKSKNRIISALLRKGFPYFLVKMEIDDWQKIE